MNKFRLSFRLLAVTNVGPSRLEVLCIRAGGDFTVHAALWQPHLKIVRLSRSEAHIARTEAQYAIWQFQELQHTFSVRRHLFKFRI
ncbi:hypothetical protein D3C73_1296260 [compost metagenome]